MSTTEIEEPIEEDENEMDPQPPRLSHKQSFAILNPRAIETDIEAAISSRVDESGQSKFVNTDNEFSTNKGQPEMSISQRNVPTRDKYRADTHSPKSGNTISRNHDSCAMSKTVEGDTVSHVYPQCSSWSPMRSCHYPR
ncbi:hypothetical protein WN943_023391 [Citrus x changshan-huyou]